MFPSSSFLQKQMHRNNTIYELSSSGACAEVRGGEIAGKRKEMAGDGSQAAFGDRGFHSIVFDLLLVPSPSLSFTVWFLSFVYFRVLKLEVRSKVGGKCKCIIALLHYASLNENRRLVSSYNLQLPILWL